MSEQELKPKLVDYPHPIDDCIRYMDYLAIYGIADGRNERVGGMCLSIAKHLSRLKEIESATHPGSEVVPEGTMEVLEKISDNLDIVLSNVYEYDIKSWRRLAADHLEMILPILTRHRAAQQGK